MSDPRELLEYHLPTVGTVKARLYPLATKCYRLLREEGHIDRLEHLDQLGIIRDIFQGAHHSRWEYTMAQLALIDGLSTAREGDEKVAWRSGLTSDTHFPSHWEGKPASGADVLQCWVLLLNAGHLDGTFASERAFLRILTEDSVLRRAFLRRNANHDAEASRYCEEVISGMRMYDAHKAIALTFLSSKMPTADRSYVNTLIDVLKFYCLPADTHEETHTKLIRLFTRIRRLCYISLDSMYSPVPVQVDLGRALYNVVETGRNLCCAGDSPLCKELEGLQELMAREVYFHPRVLLHYEDHVSSVRKRVEQVYQQPEMWKNKTTSMIRALKKLQSSIPTPQGMANYSSYLYLPIVPDFEGPKQGGEELRALMQSACGRRHIRVSVLPDAADATRHVAIGILPRAPRGAVVSCFRGLIRELCGLAEGNRPLFMKLIHSVVTECAPTVAEKLLNVVSTANCRFDIDRSTRPAAILRKGPAAILERGTTSSAQAIDQILTRLPEVSPNRTHEMQTHAEALRLVGSRGSTLSVIAPIDVSEQGRTVTDIDGLSITSTATGLWLLIVEAKDQRKSSARTAQSQLELRLGEMGLAQALVDPQVQTLGDSAYVYARIAEC